jgi:hypothetical protein
MDRYNVEPIEQKLFEIIILKVKSNFNNEHLNFNIDNLAEQLQIESNMLNEYMPILCRILLRRNIVINHDNGSWEKIGILISIKYRDNTDLTLELNPEIKSYLQYLTDNNV